jgi:cholesterol oxidase
LARAGRKVCVLERGKEFQTGEYPDKLTAALEQVQVHSPDADIGSRTGLYDFRWDDDINVVVGCCLGGTSLVNANVSVRAAPWVFKDLVWPAEIRKEALRLGTDAATPPGPGDGTETLLEKGYDLAEEMLKPVPYPEGKFPKLPKQEA